VKWYYFSTGPVWLTEQDDTNGQLMTLYSTLIEDDGISKAIRATLNKHHELIKQPYQIR